MPDELDAPIRPHDRGVSWVGGLSRGNLRSRVAPAGLAPGLKNGGRDRTQDTIFVGLDVHKATISVAVASAARGGEVRFWGSIPNRGDHVRKLVEKLETKAGQLHFCYEAGPCGYGRYRQLIELGHACGRWEPWRGWRSRAGFQRRPG